MWRLAEAETLQRLFDQGVCVPAPYDFVDGVLVMQFIGDARGEPAPRLREAALRAAQAKALAATLLSQIVRMLDAGVIHGDLSAYNILLGAGGPVIIDFPQSIAVGSSVHARQLLVRDVDNVMSFLAARAGARPAETCGERLWELWSRRMVRPDSDFGGWLDGNGPPEERSAQAAMRVT
jgi:RIO kinase 1